VGLSANDASDTASRVEAFKEAPGGAEPPVYPTKSLCMCTHAMYPRKRRRGSEQVRRDEAGSDALRDRQAPQDCDGSPEVSLSASAAHAGRISSTGRVYADANCFSCSCWIKVWAKLVSPRRGVQGVNRSWVADGQTRPFAIATSSHEASRMHCNGYITHVVLR
jgi:hypothetical protein